jgi:cation transport protein ChaC
MRKGARSEAWLFAYGSLMAEGIGVECEKRLALLRGYHRAFCVYSHVYRGTKRWPGLVLGLVPGGSCSGVAFRIPAAKAESAVGKITARENVTGVYVPRRVSIAVTEGKNRTRRVSALAFVADRTHPQYAGKLSERKIARLLRQGKGTKGRALDYLRDVLRTLRVLGIEDRNLARIGKLTGVRR